MTINGQQITIGGDIITGVDGLSVRKHNDPVVYLEQNKRHGGIINPEK